MAVLIKKIKQENTMYLLLKRIILQKLNDSIIDV